MENIAHLGLGMWPNWVIKWHHAFSNYNTLFCDDLPWWWVMNARHRVECIPWNQGPGPVEQAAATPMNSGQLAHCFHILLLFGISSPIFSRSFDYFQNSSKNPDFHMNLFNFSNIDLIKTSLPYGDQTKYVQPPVCQFANTQTWPNSHSTK